MKLCFILSTMCFIVFGILFGTSALQAGNGTMVIPTEPLTSIYNQSITEPLNKAVSEVSDPSLSKFSQDLIKSYNLDSHKSIESSDEMSWLANLLPDIYNINRNALTEPLIQAGKSLKDKELVEYYHRFLSILKIGQ
jgi:hypothetical protein